MASDSQPAGLRAGFCRAVAATTALAMAAAGCSYRSTYVAPQDGRARVVWGPGDVPTVEMSGAGVSVDCSTELHQVTERNPFELTAAVRGPTYRPYGRELWIPRYYGPRIVVMHAGLAPPFPRLPLFVPRLVSPGPISGGLIGRGGGLGRSSGSFNMGGGGKEAGAVVLVLAVIAATVLPAVALGLAASVPESPKKSASAIDLANAYNDLARVDGTACAAAPPPAFDPGGYPLGPLPPQEQPR